MRFIRVLPWFSAAILSVACGSGKSDRATADGGTDDGGSSTTFTYSPTGCQYTVSPPATRNYSDLFVDDTTAVDAATGTPTRVRLGLGGNVTAGSPGYADPATMAAFVWETAASNHAAKVKLGTDPAALGDVHQGFSFTAQPPAVGLSTGKPAFFHETHVCGLKPGTTYYYQVGGGAAGSEIWSATQSFTTAASSGKLTVGVFGDARDVVTTWAAVQGRMRDAAASVQLITGDVVDIGSLESLYSQWLDAIWKDPAAPGKFLTLGQQMMIPIAGNHENEAGQFYSNFAIPGEGNFAEQYASLNVGNTHFVLIDDQPLAGTAGDASAAILAWLDKDLAAANANRANVPFIVALSHRGIYSTSLHSADGDVLQVRGLLAPIFDKYSVDMVFNGHDHEYERSKAIKAGTPPSGDPVVGSGTQYVICAGAGADPYAVGKSASPFREKSAAFGSGTPYIGAYSLLTLDGKTLTMTAYGLKASGTQVKDDDVLDTVTITH